MPEASGFWTTFSSSFLRAVYPDRCALCGRLGGENPCGVCLEDCLPWVNALPAEEPLDWVWCRYPYAGRPAQAVRRLKYSRATSLADWMSREMEVARVEATPEVDLIAPVPIHVSRRRFRGFNQAEVLCEAMPRELRWAEGLWRIRSTPPQVGLPPHERIRNLRGAFAAGPEAQGLRIAIVDDVFTTGHTAQECARALREAGAVEVGLLAFCGGQRETDFDGDVDLY